MEPTATGANSLAALGVKSLRLTYPATRKSPAVEALKGVDLEIPAGQSVALLGPNGSGKSSLMKIVSGLIPSDAGCVSVFGSTAQFDIRRRISVVFQSNGLDPHLTVEENLHCQASLYGLSPTDARDIISRELDRSGLADKRHAFVKALSLGLARRVDLVRAMLHHPQLLMLDEPTVGLDPVARERFLEDVERRRIETGITVLMTTHLIDEADRCERCVFIHEGMIVADDDPAALRHQMGGMLVTVHGSTHPGKIARNRTSIAALDWAQTPGGWKAMTENAEADMLEQLAATLARESCAFTLAPPTLADVFAQLTGVGLDSSLTEEPEEKTESPPSG